MRWQNSQRLPKDNEDELDRTASKALAEAMPVVPPEAAWEVAQRRAHGQLRLAPNSKHHLDIYPCPSSKTQTRCDLSYQLGREAMSAQRQKGRSSGASTKKQDDSSRRIGSHDL